MLIKYFKTPLLIEDFNRESSHCQVKSISLGLGLCFAYSTNSPKVPPSLPITDEYNSIVISVYKTINPIYSGLESTSEECFFNLLLFIEKQYILRILNEDVSFFDSFQNANLEANQFLQKKWLEISKRRLESIEVDLFSSSIPQSFIHSWVHQYLYELAIETHEILLPKLCLNYKSDDIQKIKKFGALIKETAFKAIPSINEMAESVGMCPTKFKKIFKEVFGKSPHQYVLDIKTEQAKMLLKTNNFTITQIAYKVGFRNPSSLTRLLKKSLL